MENKGTVAATAEVLGKAEVNILSWFASMESTRLYTTAKYDLHLAHVGAFLPFP
jgi:hypothetical protein